MSSGLARYLGPVKAATELMAYGAWMSMQRVTQQGLPSNWRNFVQTTLPDDINLRVEGTNEIFVLSYKTLFQELNQRTEDPEREARRTRANDAIRGLAQKALEEKEEKPEYSGIRLTSSTQKRASKTTRNSRRKVSPSTTKHSSRRKRRSSKKKVRTGR